MLAARASIETAGETAGAMLPAAKSYDELCARFRWKVPARYNIGVDICDKWAGGAALAAEIQNFVKTRLAAHEYPREVEFVESLPLTATGKIMRKDLRAREGG